MDNKSLKKPKTTLNITSSITIIATTTSDDELLDPKFAGGAAEC